MYDHSTRMTRRFAERLLHQAAHDETMTRTHHQRLPRDAGASGACGEELCTNAAAGQVLSHDHVAAGAKASRFVTRRRKTSGQLAA